MNGTLINTRVSAPDSRLHKMLQDGSSDTNIITTFTLLALSRLPRPDELQTWQQQVAAKTSDERRQQLEDFLWSLLNSQEFRRIP
jgi:hypothetical protein